MADTESTDEPVRFMRQLVSNEYVFRPTPLALEYGRELAAGRILGHRCPQCGLVATPPSGFCSICVVPTTTEADGVELADRGTVTAFTVVEPIQYEGQEETETYAIASILLDGASGTMGQQRIAGLPLDEVRMGLRVEAVWLPEEKRNTSNPRAGLAGAISHWKPSGEPDTPLSKFAEHII